MQTPVGAIGLEGLMNRANIYFTSGYRFSGSIDADALKASFLAIVGAMRKFEYRLHFEAQDRFDWRHADSHRRHFSVVDCDDIDRGFAELCRDSLSLAADNAHCPMALTVLRQRGGNEFIIAQTCEHTYLDARSAEYLFNHLIGHYNAQMRGDEARQHDIVEAVRRVRTITGEKMLEILGLDDETHNQNLAALGRYAVADDGGHAIPLRDVPGCLENYRKQRFAPISRFFALGDLLGRCRQRYPEVTQNSVICAALAKGFYDLNRQTKQLQERQTISFKMLSDLLAPELRESYGGNYIAFVPVSVDGQLPVEEIARQIHERVREFKTGKIDVSLFRAVEDATREGLVGTADDALSFVVTNWNNYTFLNQPDYLHGCTSLRHHSGVNIDPRDTLGAVLVNRPILVINLSSPNEVCLSLFPSLRAEAENEAVVEYIGKVFGQ
ncbi:MAG: hypothetical protein QG638_2815 [Pseudomonadota bacterium]|nr:hypothetical protein [Pseudomonadota bacterium]MDQ5903778.1 hypothetical protein [Pseudomonadota bacterium]